eukprot:CAMPEP_0197556304 /NCGR_PEP_ID=MMETSP1320-20131121/14912_1 /TAXON_ID=91990 /ORGANISM="Bolidomonas sp., Strain RCC2347" /LENGTH=65 /DNA_ID=CAMNT_0043117419 /DNA_START=21 /DNA_END=215 /DNA_ORIENTATION=-
MNMANTYMVGLKDFKKAEQMYRLSLDGLERSLGKGHESTKKCAKSFAKLYSKSAMNDEEKLRALV